MIYSVSFKTSEHKKPVRLYEEADTQYKAIEQAISRYLYEFRVDHIYDLSVKEIDTNGKFFMPEPAYVNDEFVTDGFVLLPVESCYVPEGVNQNRPDNPGEFFKHFWKINQPKERLYFADEKNVQGFPYPVCEFVTASGLTIRVQKGYADFCAPLGDFYASGGKHSPVIVGDCKAAIMPVYP